MNIGVAMEVQKEEEHAFDPKVKKLPTKFDALIFLKGPNEHLLMHGILHNIDSFSTPFLQPR